jgi:predicted ArsR family transcriptional regulator
MINLPIIKDMKGMTIDEIAEELGIPWKTAHKRIETLGIKPLSYKALYDRSVVEQIRNVPGKGRPPKAKAETPAEPANKAKK